MIKHSLPTVIDHSQLYKNIKKIIKSKYFAENEFVKKFETELCKFFGLRYAICVSSGSVALYVALLSLSLEKDSEVIIPSYTCSAVLNCVIQCGLKPIIVDVNLQDCNISYEEVKKHITKKTKAIIVPHMFGYPAYDIEKIANLGIALVEDTTQSIGAKIKGKLVGSFGDINVVSFYATKMLTTFGEGGAILTNNSKIYDFIKNIKNYDKKQKFALRYNFKLSEVQAAMGLVQLKHIKFFMEKRKKIFECYKNGLKNCNNLDIFEPLKDVQPVFYRFLIQLKNKVKLDKLIAEYKKFGIEVARPIYLPLDRYYLGRFSCKNSKILYQTTLSLPIYPSLKKREVEYIIKVTKKLIE